MAARKTRATSSGSLARLALALLLFAPIAGAEPAGPAPEESLQRAASRGGIAALLAELDRLMAATPDRVATPESAAEIARAAANALPASSLDSAAYAAIAEHVLAAVPATAKADVAPAIRDALADVAAESAHQKIQRELATILPAQPDLSGSDVEPQAGAPTAESATAAAELAELSGEARREPAPGSAETLAEQPAFPSAPLQGVEIGAFRVYPRFVAGALYDDNIYATRTDTVDDFVVELTPSIFAESVWQRHQLNLEAGSALSFYSENSDQNTQDFWASAEGRYDLSGQDNAFGGLWYSREHEDRESPDAVNGKDPTLVHVARGYAGTLQRFGSTSIRLGSTATRINYDDVSAAGGGEIDNSFRDRYLVTGGLRLGYDLSNRFELFTQSAFDLRRYDRSQDGVSRNSNGWRFLAGLEYSPADNLIVEVYAGSLGQLYGDGELPNVVVPTFGGRLNWTASPLTTFSAWIDRDVEETRLTGASANLFTYGGIAAEHALSERLAARMRFTYGNRNFEGISRDDGITTASLGVRYFVTPYVYVDANYRLHHLASSDSIDNYDRDLVFLGFGVQAFPGFTAPSAEMRAAWSEPHRFGGFYLTGLVGYGDLQSQTQGPRGPVGESFSADFGDHGASWGFDGGWGWTYGPLYVGLEGSLQNSGVDLRFVREERRSFSIKKGFGYGGGGRLGFVILDRALLYARAGVMWTRFRTRYEVSAGAFDEDDTQLGVQFGGGIEVPVARSAFLRFDYAWTDYDRYEVDYVTGADKFDVSEGLFLIGAGFRF